jgi:hypothetical protein
VIRQTGNTELEKTLPKDLWLNLRCRLNIRDKTTKNLIQGGLSRGGVNLSKANEVLCLNCQRIECCKARVNFTMTLRFGACVLTRLGDDI